MTSYNDIERKFEGKLDHHKLRTKYKQDELHKTKERVYLSPDLLLCMEFDESKNEWIMNYTVDDKLSPFINGDTITLHGFNFCPMCGEKLYQEEEKEDDNIT
jgi:hypothetical protein